MSLREQVVVIGAAGFGRESLDVLQAMREDGSPLDVLGVVDDLPSQENLARLEQRGVEYLGTIDEWLAAENRGTSYVLGIGNPLIRRRLADSLKNTELAPFDAIHPTAIIGSRPVFKPGVVICAGAVISTNVQLGRHVHINPHATVGHDAIIEDYVSINPSAVVSGDVRIHREVLVGAKAVILQQLTVQDRVTIGAGSVITKDIPSGKIVKGVPGRWNK